MIKIKIKYKSKYLRPFFPLFHEAHENDKDLIFKCEFMNIMTMKNRSKDEINMKITPKSKKNKAKQQRKHEIGNLRRPPPPPF